MVLANPKHTVLPRYNCGYNGDSRNAKIGLLALHQNSWQERHVVHAVLSLPA